MSSYNWKELDKFNLIYEEKDTIFIKNKDCKTIPLECPRCKYLLSSIQDVNSYNENNLCDECYKNYPRQKNN